MGSHVNRELFKFLLANETEFFEIADVVVVLRCQMIRTSKSCDKLLLALKAVVMIRNSFLGKNSVAVGNVHGENLSSSLQLLRTFRAFVDLLSVSMVLLLDVLFVLTSFMLVQGCLRGVAFPTNFAEI